MLRSGSVLSLSNNDCVHNSSGEPRVILIANCAIVLCSRSFRSRLMLLSSRRVDFWPHGKEHHAPTCLFRKFSVRSL